MAKVEEAPEREQRIAIEILVDAYDEDERVMGWYASLEDQLHCPFRARCTTKLQRSPLKVGEEVVVTGMVTDDEVHHDMLVLVQWQGRELAVPLTQLEPLDADADTQEIIGDWHYWVARGHEF